MFFKNKNYQDLQTEKNQKIQEIYKDEINNQCFDCGKPNPNFISANNGVFICEDCMGIHYQFSDEISLLIKNNLFLLNEQQINYIYYGGNRKLLEFINYEYPELQNYQPGILYKTQAMQYYRDNLFYMVEGGNKPIKPDDFNAYKLIPDLLEYSMTEKREKDDDNYIDNDNNNQNDNLKLMKADEQNEIEEQIFYDKEEDNSNTNQDINIKNICSIYDRYFTNNDMNGSNKKNENKSNNNNNNKEKN